jgi:hypothetical protein
VAAICDAASQRAISGRPAERSIRVDERSERVAVKLSGTLSPRSEMPSALVSFRQALDSGAKARADQKAGRYIAHVVRKQQHTGCGKTDQAGKHSGPRLWPRQP